jgi:hypothetical protein
LKFNYVKDEFIFVKSHFAGRGFGDGENSGNEEKIQDKYILGSLTSKTKRDFGNGERLRGKERGFGEKTVDKNIL